jgi:hypothetical protein
MNDNNFDHAEALRFDVIRLGGVVEAAANVTAVACKAGYEELAKAFEGKVAKLVERVVEAEKAVVAAVGIGSGTATGVVQHPCPDPVPAVCGESAQLAGLQAQVAALQAQLASPKSADAAPWDWAAWYEVWTHFMFPPLALLCFGYGLFRCERRPDRFGFLLLGFLLSPHLGVAAMGVWTALALKRCWWGTKRRIQQTPLGRCCCPRSAADQEEDRRRVEGAAAADLRRADRGDNGRSSVVDLSAGEFLSCRAEPDAGFVAYVRDLASNPRYQPLANSTTINAW